MAALLLDVPYLQAAGGLLLLWIAYRLLRPHDHNASVNEAASLGEAIRTIVLADVVMSLDNILAVGAAAEGDIRLLLFGLILSIPILLLGSELVARMLGRFPILVYVGALVLILTAVEMFFRDAIVHGFYPASTAEVVLVSAVLGAIIIALGVRAQRAVSPLPPPEASGREPRAVEVTGAGRAERAASQTGEPIAPG
jgi:predicted tellurium resistance membrane protein TerC